MDFIKRIVVKQFLKEVPIMKKLIDWLKDPAASGRKRGVAAVAGIIAVGLRAIESGLHDACKIGDLVGSVCNVNASLIADIFSSLSTFLNTIVVPGADAVTILVGAWGLWVAHKRSQENKPA